MKKYDYKMFDKKNNRLLFIGTKSDSNFWDEFWNDENFEKQMHKKDKFVLKTTQKYLNQGDKVIEGGCGRGDKVWTLMQNGFDSVGIDYAEETVKKIKEVDKNLNIQCQDLRALDFTDNYFDGYWSIGVIEHFLDGYNDIQTEMLRVVKPNGYLFLTFPSMSFIRELKGRLGMYVEYDSNKINKDTFYQYTLDANKVISDFEEVGFKLVRKIKYDGFKGAKEELGWFKFLSGHNIGFFTKVLRKIIDISFATFCNHTTVLILKKNLK